MSPSPPGIGHRIRHSLGLSVAVLCTVVLAACGSGGAPAADTSAPQAASADLVQQAKQATERNFAGTHRRLPADGPPAVRGKKVWAIVCNTQGAGCVRPANAALEAGGLLGWDMQLLDGRQDPALYNAHLRAAAAAGVDAVMLFGVDCAQVAASIEEVRRAGVKVYGSNSLDCDDKYATGGRKLFDAHLWFGENGGDYGDFASSITAPAIANWIIARTDGQAKVIELQEDDAATTRHVGEAFRAEMARCTSCEVWQVPYTGPEIFNGKLQAKVTAALTRHPTANVVMAPLDAAVTLGAGPAVAQAKTNGRGDLLVTGNEGNPENLKLIADGLQSFAVGRPMEWSGWATVDGVNRMLAGEEQVDPGFGATPVDAEHLPQAGDLDAATAAATGYKENYKRIWGVG